MNSTIDRAIENLTLSMSSIDTKPSIKFFRASREKQNLGKAEGPSGGARAPQGGAGVRRIKRDQAKFFAAKSQFTSAQKFSRYLGRALR